MDKKEQTRLRVQRYRERQNSVTSALQKPPESVTKRGKKVTKALHDVTLLGESCNAVEAKRPSCNAIPTVGSVTLDIKKEEYPHILYILANPQKRDKLQRICEALERRKLLSEVYYGCGKQSIDMETVSQLLECFA